MPEFESGFKDSPRAKLIREKAGDKGCKKHHSVVSMFSGCGGMDFGFLGGFEFLGEYYKRLPFKVLQAYDNEPKAIETYKLNIDDHATVCDLTETDPTTIPSCDVLLGGFPCQDFSSCGPKVGFDGKRGKLYRIMVDYAATHQPAVVVAENVPYLAKLSNGELLQTIIEEFEEIGYVMRVWELFCPDFGLPQNRTRLFIVGVRSDIAEANGFPYGPEPTHFMRHVTIDDAIGDLSKVEDESVCNQSQYFVATKATKGAGQGDQVSVRGEVSYAVRANPKARVHFHYELPRRLTVRECARLQSFPDEFAFPFSTSNNMMQIGNAVPPIVAHKVASEIALFMSKVRRKKPSEALAT